MKIKLKIRSLSRMLSLEIILNTYTKSVKEVDNMLEMLLFKNFIKIGLKHLQMQTQIPYLYSKIHSLPIDQIS